MSISATSSPSGDADAETRPKSRDRGFESRVSDFVTNCVLPSNEAPSQEEGMHGDRGLQDEKGSRAKLLYANADWIGPFNDIALR